MSPLAVPSSAADAWLALRLFAIDPAALGGVCLRAGAGPVRDAWLADLRALLRPDVPWRKLPVHIDTERLLGGLDLAATLQLGRRVAQTGLLADADGGVVVAAMAERARAETVAQVAAALDSGAVQLARDGIEQRSATRFGLVALDESAEDDEPVAERWRDRLALHVDLADIAVADAEALRPDASTIEAVAVARMHMAQASTGADAVEALCAAALALGVDSIRACLHAARVVRASAALAGRTATNGDDAAVAARLVLAPRATRLPPAASDDEPYDDPADADADADAEQEQQASAEDTPTSSPENEAPGSAEAAPDVVLAAARASIPRRLLQRLAAGPWIAPRGASGSGAQRLDRARGQRLGAARALPRGGARLDLVATLRAAAPWQRLRGGLQPSPGASRSDSEGPAWRPQLRAEDFHVVRRLQRSHTTTIFAVDASGSSANQRLAEAKGAVELLLAECYVRRDSVAVIAFRGRGSELLLAPTRSLVRAKRSLAELPGGGGTPLAAGLDAAVALAAVVRRRGDTPVLVVLTDGRANVARDGRPGRERADAEARDAARRLRAAGLGALLIDTSPQPQPRARELADDMAAHYLPLPYAGAEALSKVVQQVSMAATPGRAGSR